MRCSFCTIEVLNGTMHTHCRQVVKRAEAQELGRYVGWYVKNYLEVRHKHAFSVDGTHVTKPSGDAL